MIQHVDRDPVEQYGRWVLTMTDRERAPFLDLSPEIPTPGEELRRIAGILELVAFASEDWIRKHMVSDLRVIALRVDQMLTLEMVEKAVRDELSILRDDVVDVAVNGVMERLRQQMGGEGRD